MRAGTYVRVFPGPVPGRACRSEPVKGRSAGADALQGAREPPCLYTEFIPFAPPSPLRDGANARGGARSSRSRSGREGGSRVPQLRKYGHAVTNAR